VSVALAGTALIDETRTGAADTVIFDTAENFPSGVLADIDATPFAFPYTLPLWSTVATETFDDDQTTRLSVAFEGVIVA
jgi:hypothetical protein